MSCQTLGTLEGLTDSQYSDYKSAVAIYNNVEAFNSNVFTLRAAGNKSLSYYQFKTVDESIQYKVGLMILIQTNPTVTYTQVQKI